MAERSSLVRLQEEFDVEVEWKGFQLHPGTPRGGVPLDRLFGGRAEMMRSQVAQFARGFGVSIQVPGHLYNTRRVLALTEWAREQGRFQAFYEAAMEAHWQRGEDLENPDVLARLAEQAGLPGEEARSAMDAPQYQARVEALREEGEREGVQGIPTFFIGDVRVVGCQPYEVFAEAARRAGAQPRR
ncbi:thioredoxin domain-containing protein [Archangium minus]|uniref:Thioredoxin domain-containing protein n=1 Tax=Archangium minus TaxID=83450 RepID=A0ABY9WKL7_9BACT|nr:thioredoxin domain-containing protein [Archangium minus]